MFITLRKGTVSFAFPRSLVNQMRNLADNFLCNGDPVTGSKCDLPDRHCQILHVSEVMHGIPPKKVCSQILQGTDGGGAGDVEAHVHAVHAQLKRLVGLAPPAAQER
jgi:hypothetical protein